MKFLISMIFSFLSFQAFAQDSAMNLSDVGTSQTSIEQSAPARKNDPKWQLLIGQSNYQMGDRDEKGSGIAVSVRRELTKMIGLGAGFAQYKSKYNYMETDFNGNERTRTIQDTHEAYSAFLTVTPIRYAFSQAEFTAGLQAGQMYGTFEADQSHSATFYGADLGLSLSKQMGISFSAISSKAFDSMNSVNLIGYF